VEEVCGCDSNSAFTTLPSDAGTPLFMFLKKKNEKKVQCKISMETYFRVAENAVVLCKNFDTEGKIHLVVAVQCQSQQAWDQTYDKWYCVVISYAHGSLTDFYKIFESVASNISSQKIFQDTSFFPGLLTMVALLVSTTPRTVSTYMRRTTLEKPAQKNP